MKISPSQVNTETSEPPANRRATNPIGMSNALTTSNAPNNKPACGSAASPPKAGAMRQPTQAWSRLEMRNRGTMGKIGSQ